MFLNRLKSFLFRVSSKLTLLCSSVLLVSFLCLSVLLYFQVKQVVQNQELSALDSKIIELKIKYQKSGLKDFSADLNTFVMVLSPRGEVFFLQEAQPNLKIDFEFLKMEVLKIDPHQSRITIQESYGDKDIDLVTGMLPDGNRLIVARSPEVMSAYFQQLQAVFIWFLIPVVLIAVLGGLLLSQKTSSPIRALIVAMKKIESGSLSTRVPVGGGYEELEELKILSNKMLDKIEGLVNGLKEAFDHLAHDIRTPVTRLRGRAELALTDDADMETLREALQSCYENSDKILNFLQVLTDITEAENRSRRLKLNKRYISDIVREIMSLYEMSFEEKNVRVVQKLDTNDWAMVDERLISRVIANLLDNAYKYTPSEGEVTIETINQTETVVLRVTDTGPGIAANEHAMIWQKLYRSDKSRSEYGMGLGLTFVKAVVEAHDGKVSVHSPVRDGHGTQFEITLQKMS